MSDQPNGQPSQPNEADRLTKSIESKAAVVAALVRVLGGSLSRKEVFDQKLDDQLDRGFVVLYDTVMAIRYHRVHPEILLNVCQLETKVDRGCTVISHSYAYGPGLSNQFITTQIRRDTPEQTSQAAELLKEVLEAARCGVGWSGEPEITLEQHDEEIWVYFQTCFGHERLACEEGL